MEPDTSPAIWCDSCWTWLRRPKCSGYAVIYCKLCNSSLSAPRLWSIPAMSEQHGSNTGILNLPSHQRPSLLEHGPPGDLDGLALAGALEVAPT